MDEAEKARAELKRLLKEKPSLVQAQKELQDWLDKSPDRKELLKFLFHANALEMEKYYKRLRTILIKTME